MPRLAPRMDVLSWGRRDFQISFSNRDMPRNAWNRQWGSFMVDTGSYQAIWSFPFTNVKWHSVTWMTMTTPFWSDFVPNSNIYRILSGFHRTFATGVACRQGTLIIRPPDSVPLRLAYVQLLETNPFSELVVIFFFGPCSSNTHRYFLDFASMLIFHRLLFLNNVRYYIRY